MVYGVWYRVHRKRCTLCHLVLNTLLMLSLSWLSTLCFILFCYPKKKQQHKTQNALLEYSSAYVYCLCAMCIGLNVWNQNNISQYPQPANQSTNLHRHNHCATDHNCILIMFTNSFWQFIRFRSTTHCFNCNLIAYKSYNVIILPVANFIGNNEL